MIDARNTFRKITRKINDFSPEQLEGLTAIIKSYRGHNVNFSSNDWLTKIFPNGKYEDVEGLCKVTTKNEIIKNDYSLMPGKYVGFSVKIDEDFDYKGRISEIHNELNKLNDENNKKMKEIQKLKL